MKIIINDWEDYYKQEDVESMPWFYAELDHSFEQTIKSMTITTGDALDIGTGPGTQAVALARLGLNVTAIDISPTAIKKAQLKYSQEKVNVNFIQDDILSSKLDKKFDLVFDRGCFHAISPERRKDYVTTVSNLIKPEGFLFLKCFSYLEPGEEGPYRFNPEQITEIFNLHFNINSIEETVFKGNKQPSPQALFCILKKLV